MAIVFDAVQSATSSVSNPAVATFGATPTEGNLLVAVGTERSGTSAASATISGSGWTQRIARDVEIADGTYRRSMSVWTKIAGASEPTAISIDNGTANNMRAVAVEYEAGAAVTWTFEAAASNDNGATSDGHTLATGTTSSVGAGDQLLIGMLYVKGDASAEDRVISWESSTLAQDAEADSTGTYDQTVSVASLQESASGTKASTATVAPGYSTNVGLIAGILVFTASEGSSSIAPIAMHHLRQMRG